MTDRENRMNKGTAQKRSVLMICASFFGYDKRICRALQDEGYEVDLVDEKPNSSFVAKACIRYNVRLYRPAIRKYYEEIIGRNRQKKYDYILVVKGEAVNEEIIGLLRQAYPDAGFVLYLWDSVANIPDCEKRMKLYDRVLTFDPADAEKYGIPHVAIPYGEEHINCQRVGHFEYDVAFVGTAHSVRPRVVKQIQQQCLENGRKCFVYFYSPHILVYLLNKLTNRDYRWIKKNEVHFQALPPEEVCRVYNVSKCVLDIEHPKQQGATTRPVEMLPMQKKIITTNSHVRDFPFFNTNNYHIIDRNDPRIDASFFDTQYIPVDEEIVKQYSPSCFVKILMG